MMPTMKKTVFLTVKSALFCNINSMTS